jgi:aminodeoxyfutalosine synthase
MLKTLAIARIYLDNIDHIKAYCVFMGLKLAQVSLSYGVDDLDGTVIEEKIYHMAGAKTPQEMARGELVKAIRETGREPVQRDSLYRTVNPDAVGRGGPAPPPADTFGGLEPASSTEASYAGANNEGGAA